jgi:alkylation response protein AidB-like acyl-CoA dehydrogenase
MDFQFSAEHQELIQVVRKIAREKVAPLASQIDEREEIPAELFNTLRDAGLFGIAVPAEYGGADMGILGLVLAT